MAQEKLSKNHEQVRDIERLQSACWDEMLANPESAGVMAEKSIAIARVCGSKEHEGLGCFMRAWCHYYSGQYTEAAKQHKNAIALFIEGHQFDRVGRVFNGLGAVNQATGQFGIALQHYESARSLSPKSVKSEGYVAALINLVSLYCSAGHWESALTSLNELDSMDTSKLSEEQMAELTYVRALLWLDTRDLDAVEPLIVDAETAAAKLQFRQLIYHVKLLKSRLLIQKGEFNGALDILQLARQEPWFVDQGAERFEAFTYIAQCFSKLGETDKAEQAYKEALLLDTGNLGNQLLLDLIIDYAEFLVAQKRFQEATAVQRRAFDMQKELYDGETASVESNRLISTEIYRIKKEEQLKANRLEAAEALHRQTELINQVGQYLASTLDLGEIGLRLHRLAQKEFDAHFISISECLPERKAILLQLVVDEGVSQPTKIIPLDTPGLQSAKVVETQKTVLIEDYTPSEESKLQGSDSQPRSAVFLPLKIQDNLIGIWSLQSPIVNRFNRQNTKLLEALAPFVAIAYNNSVTHQRLNELNMTISKEKADVERANEIIAYEALHDGLTDLPNRRHLGQEVTKMIRKAQHKGGFHLLYIDLNDFKQVNDEQGHAVGDLVLQEISARLKDFFRKTDLLARVGGDEFVALVSEFEEYAHLEDFVTRLKGQLSYPVRIKQLTFQLGASVGVANFPEDGRTLDDLMIHADKQMYLDKKSKTQSLMEQK